MWVVRLALNRPYTFIVMALAIMLMTPVTLLRTPTDIFPDINIPVISLVYTFTGLSPEDIEHRIASNAERGLTTLVNDIEHIESQSLPGIAVIKVYFQPNANIQTALAQTSGDRAEHAAAAAARHHAAARRHLLGVDRARAADRAHERDDVRAAALRLGQQLHPHAAGDRAGRRAAAARTAASSG